MSKSCSKIASGQIGCQIATLIQSLEIISARKIVLRIGYEFDYHFFGYLSYTQAYLQSFQMIVTANTGTINQNT